MEITRRPKEAYCEVPEEGKLLGISPNEPFTRGRAVLNGRSKKAGAGVGIVSVTLSPSLPNLRLPYPQPIISHHRGRQRDRESARRTWTVRRIEVPTWSSLLL